MQAKPTHARHLVILFAITLAIITYIDRFCMGQAEPNIRADLHLSKVQMSYIFAAFAWAYALFEIPGGWMGDWLGPRRVLLRIVICWSVMTAVMGSMWNLGSMTTANFLFGAGEAGCFPNLTKVFTTWLPHRERVRAQGILWMFARWGGAFTPMLVAWMLHWVTWRQAFRIFGLLGVVWALVFYRWFRDDPRRHPAVNAAEQNAEVEALRRLPPAAHVLGQRQRARAGFPRIILVTFRDRAKRIISGTTFWPLRVMASPPNCSASLNVRNRRSLSSADC